MQLLHHAARLAATALTHDACDPACHTKQCIYWSCQRESATCAGLISQTQCTNKGEQQETGLLCGWSSPVAFRIVMMVALGAATSLPGVYLGGPVLVAATSCLCCCASTLDLITDQSLQDLKVCLLPPPLFGLLLHPRGCLRLPLQCVPHEDVFKVQ